MTRVLAASVLLLILPRQGAIDLERLPFAPRSAICYRASGSLTIDGRLDEPSWRAAPWSDAFVDIEGGARPAPRLATRNKVLWDDQYLYVAADLEEPDIWGTITTRDGVIYQDNDFEVFVDPDGDSHEYYELEINALNTVWDLLLIRPYRDGGPAINRWDIAGLKTGVDVRGTLNRPGDKDDGWSVEIAIPWKALTEAAPGARPPRGGEHWRINFSRVQWQLEQRDGRYAKRTTREGDPLPENNWVWSPQGAIDMHMPERWGYVQFSETPVVQPVTKDTPAVHSFRADTFIADPDESTRWALRRVYYRQADYRKSHGRYARNLTQLNAGGFAADGIQLHATDDLYVLTAPAPSGGQLTLRQDGRLWKTDPVGRIPFPWPGVGQIEIPVSVNGGAPVTFLVDTGAEYSIISAALADRLGIGRERQGSRDFAHGIALSFGGLSMRDQHVMVMPFDGYGRRVERSKGSLATTSSRGTSSPSTSRRRK